MVLKITCTWGTIKKPWYMATHHSKPIKPEPYSMGSAPGDS